MLTEAFRITCVVGPVEFEKCTLTRGMSERYKMTCKPIFLRCRALQLNKEGAGIFLFFYDDDT